MFHTATFVTDELPNPPTNWIVDNIYLADNIVDYEQASIAHIDSMRYEHIVKALEQESKDPCAHKYVKKGVHPALKPKGAFVTSILDNDLVLPKPK